MVYTNDRAADVHSSKGRRRKRSRRLRWPLKLFCMCLVLSAVVLTIRTVRSFSAPMSALEPAEQLTEQHPESSLQEPDALPPVELNPAPQSGAVTPDDWQILLVNRWNPLPENYRVNLVEVPGGQQVDERIYQPLMEMLEAAREGNLGELPQVLSGYRTQEEQEKLFQEEIDGNLAEGYSEEEARELAQQWVAVPGTSEHQLGLAVDLGGATYDVFFWLQEHSWEYGFIWRYPGDKTDLTGTAEEVWHYRYVGKEAAKEIYEQGVCLEEYLEQKKEENGQ
mgnify:FL=1